MTAGTQTGAAHRAPGCAGFFLTLNEGSNKNALVSNTIHFICAIRRSRPDMPVPWEVPFSFPATRARVHLGNKPALPLAPRCRTHLPGSENMAPGQRLVCSTGYHIASLIFCNNANLVGDPQKPFSASDTHKRPPLAKNKEIRRWS